MDEWHLCTIWTLGNKFQNLLERVKKTNFSVEEIFGEMLLGKWYFKEMYFCWNILNWIGKINFEKTSVHSYSVEDIE